MDRHYNHSDNSYPIAHNLVTSHYLSGAVRFPVDSDLYERYETVTDWERFVAQHFPSQSIPTKAKDRTILHRQLDQQLRVCCNGLSAFICQTTEGGNGLKQFKGECH